MPGRRVGEKIGTLVNGSGRMTGSAGPGRGRTSGRTSVTPGSTGGCTVPAGGAETGQTHRSPVIDETLLEAEEKMEKAVAVAQGRIRRASVPAAPPRPCSARSSAEYYGAHTPINQLASFHIPEPRMAVISPSTSLAAGHREGDPEQRPRRQPVQRRRDHPGELPAAHRGAPPRVDQGRPAQGRGRQDLDPQRSAGMPRTPWTSWSRTARRARTTAAGPSRELDDVTHIYRAGRRAARKGAELARCQPPTKN